MDKNYKLFLILGIIILIVPFLGFPEVVGSVILFIVGVVLIVTALMYRAHFSISNDDLDYETTETIYIDSDKVRTGKKRGRKPKKKDEIEEINIEMNGDETIEVNIVDDEEETKPRHEE